MLQPPSSVDYNTPGAPFEDLRRRLSAINGSGTSLPSAARESHRVSSASAHSPLLPAGLLTTTLLPVSDRPGSPTESVLSNTNSAAFRAVHRLQVGSTEKAAPAVGSSRANAIGLLEHTSKMRSEGSPERSGRSSPISTTGTIRGQPRSRVPSLPPISTYGVYYQCDIAYV